MKTFNKIIFLCTFLSLCSITLFIYLIINIGKPNSLDALLPFFAIVISMIVAIVLSILGIIISGISKKRGAVLLLKIKSKEFDYISLYRNIIILVISIYPTAVIVAGIVNLLKVLPIWLGLE